MNKLSVIIPVFNTSKYIRKCLDSIVNQSMKDIELIIVNDGSEDNSETVIKHWIEKNKHVNVKYLKKENSGLSDARNYGIRFATGKYIAFIDSDDYIDKNLFKNLEKYMADDIEVIKFKIKTVDEKGKIIEKLEGPVFEKCTGEEAFEKLCTEDKYIDPACIYLYRREFWVSNKFKYSVGTYHEDFGLTPLVIINAKSFVSTDQCGYNYLQRNDSITGDKDIEKEIKKAYDVLKHYDNMIEQLNTYSISKKTKDLVKRYYTNAVILKAEELIQNKEEFNKYEKELKKRKIYINIKPYNIKQFIKRIVLKFSIKQYLRMR